MTTQNHGALFIGPSRLQWAWICRICHTYCCDLGLSFLPVFVFHPHPPPEPPHPSAACYTYGYEHGLKPSIQPCHCHALGVLRISLNSIHVSDLFSCSCPGS